MTQPVSRLHWGSDRVYPYLVTIRIWSNSKLINTRKKIKCFSLPPPPISAATWDSTVDDTALKGGASHLHYVEDDPEFVKTLKSGECYTTRVFCCDWVNFKELNHLKGFYIWELPHMGPVRHLGSKTLAGRPNRTLQEFVHSTGSYLDKNPPVHHWVYQTGIDPHFKLEGLRWFIKRVRNKQRYDQW